MVEQIDPKQITSFQNKILYWYQQNNRKLPWRDVPYGTSFQDATKGKDLNIRAYQILISEIMSQQTQLARVIPKFIAWCEGFPTIIDLANAPTSEVLRMWSGLGYNRRALFLQKTAKSIVTEHNGIWPRSVEELKKLPGIGDYTAAAIACFAFNAQVAVVDTNIRKVILVQIYQYICTENDPAQTPRNIQAIASQLLPEGQAYHWNQALMDYAAAELKSEKIPIPKQSTFKGSNRYYRGKILKLLLEHHTLDEESLRTKLQGGEGEFETIKLVKLLEDLEKDGFIKKEGMQIRLIEK